MKGSEIHALLRGVKMYGGVLAFDQLNLMRAGKLYVVNSKPSTHPGLHWLVIDLTKRKPYFFDSFGRPPKYYGLPPMQHWDRALQDARNDTCGVWCAYFVVQRSRRRSPHSMFSIFVARNKQHNDERILKWLKNRLYNRAN